METAIKKAIEGGYKCGFGLGDSYPESYKMCRDYSAVLDPAFWQALGKAEGWGRLHCTNCGEFARPIRKKDSDPEYWFDCCGRKRNLEYGVSYVGQWHRLIDHLAEGKDADSFFADLLSDKLNK